MQAYINKIKKRSFQFYFYELVHKNKTMTPKGSNFIITFGGGLWPLDAEHPIIKNKKRSFQ